MLAEIKEQKNCQSMKDLFPLSFLQACFFSTYETDPSADNNELLKASSTLSSTKAN